MNLNNLVSWIDETRDLKNIRGIVRKDPKGNPNENDVNIGLKMLGEIKKRAILVEDHLKKAQKYQEDIAEYLADLEKRGVIYKEKVEVPVPVPVPALEKEEVAKEEVKQPIDNSPAAIHKRNMARDERSR